MPKKGSKTNKLLTMKTLVAVALLVGAVYTLDTMNYLDQYKGKSAESQAVGGIQTQTITEAVQTVTDCNSNRDVIIPITMTDPDAATPTSALSAASSAYAQNTATGILFSTTATSISGETLMNLTPICGNKDAHVINVVTKAGSYSSVESAPLAFTKSRLDPVNLKVNQISYGSVKIKDVDTDSWLYCFANGNSTGTNSSTTTTLNMTNCYSDNAATATAKGSDSALRLELNIQSAAARKYMNEKGRNNYLCLDINNGTTSEAWDANQVTVSIEGNILPEARAMMNNNDLDFSRVKTSERCYQIGDVGYSWKPIQITVNTLASTDPSSTTGIVCGHILAEGSYLSSLQSNKIVRGVATDATTKVAVVESTSYQPTFCVMIS